MPSTYLDIFSLFPPISEEHPKDPDFEGEENVCWPHLVRVTGWFDVLENSGLFEEDWLPLASARLGVGEVSQHPRFSPVLSGEIRKWNHCTRFRTPQRIFIFILKTFLAPAGELNRLLFLLSPDCPAVFLTDLSGSGCLLLGFTRGTVCLREELVYFLATFSVVTLILCQNDTFPPLIFESYLFHIWDFPHLPSVN